MNQKDAGRMDGGVSCFFRQQSARRWLNRTFMHVKQEAADGNSAKSSRGSCSGGPSRHSFHRGPSDTRNALIAARPVPRHASARKPPLGSPALSHSHSTLRFWLSQLESHRNWTLRGGVLILSHLGDPAGALSGRCGSDGGMRVNQLWRDGSD